MSYVDPVISAPLSIVGSGVLAMTMDLGPTEGELYVEGAGDLSPVTFITNVRAISSNRIRIDFSGALDKNSQLAEPSNYTIAGYAKVTIQSVYVPDAQYPTSIDLVTSEMTDGSSYTVACSALITSGGYPVLETPFAFTGTGEAPTVVVAIATSSTTFEIRFSESIRDTVDIRDLGAYVFTDPPALTVEEFVSVVGNVITLRTSEQTEAVLYELTIDGEFKDLAGNAMTVPVVTNMLGYREPETVEEPLQLEMYNFLGKNIRDADQNFGHQFLERWYRGPQEIWKTLSSAILNVSRELWSPVDIPDRLVGYLSPIVGWNGALASVTAALDTDTHRRLIESSVAFWKGRGPEDVIESIILLTTSARAEIWTYFDYRWVLGDTHLGVERDGLDPWAISHAPYTYDEPVIGGRDIFVGDVEALQSESLAMGEGMDALVVFVVTYGGRLPTYLVPTCIDTMTYAGLEMNHLGYVQSSNPDFTRQMRTDVFWLRGLLNRTEDLEWQITKDSGASSLKWKVFAVRVKNFLTVRATTGKTSYADSSPMLETMKTAEDEVILSLCSCNLGEFQIDPVSPTEALEDLQWTGFASRLAYTPGADGPTSAAFDVNGESVRMVQELSIVLQGAYSGIGSGGEVEYQIRVVDDGTLDRDLVRSLARLTRPTNERVRIFYISFLDRFTTDGDLSQWTEETGTATVDSGTLILPEGVGEECSVYVSVDNSEVWDDYVATWRVKGNDEFELLFHRSTEDDQYFVRVTTADFAPGTNGKLELYSNVAGTPTLIQTANLPDGLIFKNDVYYTIRVEIARYGTTNEIRVFLDAELLMTELDNDHSAGTIGLRNHVTAPKSVTVDEVEVFFIPAETDFIDINTRG